MARIRTIKPEFFTSEDIVGLSPFARLLYIALWCEADREGRLSWKPQTFKLRYFPGDDLDVSALCKELTDRGLVVQYGNGLAYIPTFLEHQHVNPREAQSTLPTPDASARVNDASARVTDTQVGREGKEGKGKEGKGTKTAEASPRELSTAKAADPEKEEIWRTGRAILEREGMTRDRAGSFLGKQVKDYGQKLVLQAVRDCEVTTPAKPSEWIVARCQERRAANGSRQSALEARNAEAGREFLRSIGAAQ